MRVVGDFVQLEQNPRHPPKGEFPCFSSSLTGVFLMAKASKPVDEAAVMRLKIETDTAFWTRDASDRLAIAQGMFVDVSRGEYVCAWIEENCYLSQGEGAGSPMRLMKYQRDFIMRLFSWVKWSEFRRRYIRRFVRANLICAKKNGKTPFLAAIALYLGTADGEQGNRVYVCAKNGMQAKKPQEHAVAMVTKSPNLSRSCKVNRTTLAIHHPETNSYVAILTGDDSAGAKQNEGINGSILIDELHVFDREMYERVKGAGISRAEPLNLAVSTAGDDPSSYGYERTEYGRAVKDGKRDDVAFLHVEYAAPTKATNQDIADNLEEYLRMANPAWGEIVDPAEAMQDYKESCDNPRLMNRFKQYRLSLWVGSVAPWLNEVNWAANKVDFTLEDMRGRECKLGLDLSRTRDMTAAVLTFRMGDEGEDGSELLRIWPMFWIPRKTAEARRNLFPYLDWAATGDITLTEGNVVDYTAVEEELCSAIEEHEIQVTDIFFDQHYAEELTQRLSERLNANRTAVSQSLMALSPLCKELERRIDSGNLHHPGNAVMDWQVGHVQVWTDRNQNVRPVKPDSNSGKSIDGVMATLDTMAGVVEDAGGDNEPSITFL